MEPKAQYQQLFRVIKFCQLMFQLTGDPDHGYQAEIDGPASVLIHTQRYGLSMAVLLPSLLLCSKWRFRAEVFGSDGQPCWFELDSQTTKLVSHYKEQPSFDSELERTFAEHFEKRKHLWRLERETEVIHTGQNLIIPDFRFRHQDGRSALLEIVGYWRQEYLRTKFQKLAEAKRSDLIVAINAKLRVGQAEQSHVD